MARARVVLLALMAVGTLLEVCRGSERKVYPYLDAALHHYDTLHTDHLSHTITFPHPKSQHRQVKFNTLGRDFHLHLSPNRKIFSSDFAAYVVDENNNKERYPVDRDEFYHGYLHGEPDSRVTAHISKTGVLMATIRTRLERFHVEPSQDYIKQPHPFHMVAYRASDVKNRLASTQVDYVVAPDVPISDSSSNEEVHFSTKDGDELHLKSSFHSNDGGVSKSWNRLRRQTATVFRGRITGDSCSMVLVADHTFFRQFGSSNDSVTRRVVSLISEIDTTIFRPTVWNSDVQEGFGLDIAEIMIHPRSGETIDCNQQVDMCYYSSELDNRNPEASDLLTAFNFGNWNRFCLAHLFTYRDFTSGLLGLANIASHLQRQTGGVCSRAFTDPNPRPTINIPANSRIIYNTGLSSYNSNGAPLVRDEELLVTAHELGHNWGSAHDPVNNEECRTQFLMYQFAQDGSSPSHMMFSPCSRSSIGAVLLAKGNCFQARSTVCGDYRIDEGEDCDAGPDGDTCCTVTCELTENASCSDSNFPCCMGCQPTNTRICRAVQPLSRDCTTDTVCRLDSLSCPDATPAADGAPCLGGQCVFNNSTSRTTCVSQCELNNETSCSCTELNNECLLCCMDGATCRPADGFNPLPNGSPCSLGTCFNGTCTEQVGQDTISRIWTAIITLDVNTILQFMLENLVGAVLICTTILWIPASCFVHFLFDYWVLKRFKSATEHTDHASWFSKRADKLHKLHSKSMWEEMPLIHHAQEEPPESESSPLVSSPVDTGPPPVYIRY